MVYNRPGPLRQCDRGSRTGDIGAEPGNECLTARSNELGRLGNCGIKRYRLTRNPCALHSGFTSNADKKGPGVQSYPVFNRT